MLALLVFVQFPGVIALIFGGIAKLDGEHHVSIAATSSGSEVVLKHDPYAPSDSAFSDCHDHCVVSQFLVAFEASHATEHSDHVLKFAGVSATPLKGSRAGLVKPASHGGNLPDVSSILAAAPALQTAFASSRPPPSQIESSFVRQIVLLI